MSQADTISKASSSKGDNFSGKDFENDIIPPAPSRIFTCDLPSYIRVTPDKHTAYSITDISRPGTFRSNVPMPINSYYYYFEVHIESIKHEIVVGLIGNTFDFSRRVGDAINSYGIISSGATRKNGKDIENVATAWSAGDTIGCGIFFNHSEIFFTKNGLLLDTIFEGFENVPIYPAVTLSGKDDAVRVNFGHKAFSFDVASLAKKQKISFLEKILIKPNFNISDNLISAFVSHYLLYNGYKRTFDSLSTCNEEFEIVEKFKEESEFKILLESLEKRKEIIDHIENGEIASALAAIDRHFQGCSRDAEFVLHCQLFLEVLRKEGAQSALQTARLSLRRYISPECGTRYVSALKRTLLHLATKDEAELARSVFYSKAHLARVSQFVNKAVLCKMKFTKSDPLSLLFKQLFAVDGVIREENSYYGSPLSFEEY